MNNDIYRPTCLLQRYSQQFPLKYETPHAIHIPLLCQTLGRQRLQFRYFFQNS